MFEGLATGLRSTQFIPVLVVYSGFTVAMLVMRAFVGVLQFASGWMLVQDGPFGRKCGRTALVVSAVLTTLELGFRLAPTSVFPSYRWPLVGAYWVYAMAGLWILSRSTVNTSRSA
jgi:hypothetical protein